MENRETAGSWKVSDSDNCRVVSEKNIFVAQCERPEDARMIALAPLMATLCRSGASGEALDAKHFFGNMEHVVSIIGEEIEEDDD